MRLPFVHAYLNRLPPLWKYSLLMLVFARINDLVNFYISTFLVIDAVPQEQLGALYPMQHLAILVSAPMAVAVTVGIKFINVFENRGQRNRTQRLTRDLAGITLILSCLMGVITALSFPLVAERIRLDSRAYLWALILLAVSNAWLPLARGVATGLKQWRWLILIVNVLSPLTRLLAMWLLLPALALLGYLLAQSFMNLVMLAAFGFGAWRVLRQRTADPASGLDSEERGYRDDVREMLAFAWPVALFIIAFQAQELIESWVIRQRLSEEDSAGYYYLLTFGRIPRFRTSAILPFVFILVSDKHEKGESTRALHMQTIWFTLGAGTLFAIALSLVTPWFTPLRPSWAMYATYVPLMWIVATNQALQNVISVHTAHESGVRNFAFLRSFIPILIVELGLLYGLNLWYLARNVVPEGFWMLVQDNVATSLTGTLAVMLTARALMTAVLLINLGRRGRDE